MKEIKLNIPEECKTITIKVDGEKVTTEFEPKEKFEPKDGDILYGDSITKNIIIYKGTNKLGAVRSYAGLVLFLGETLSIPNESYTGFGYTKDYTRYATEEEKQLLFDKLSEEGYRWNAEKKELEKLSRWRADANQYYFYITSKLEVGIEDEVFYSIDNARYNSCNYFKTEEAAERVVKQIRGIFKNSKAE